MQVNYPDQTQNLSLYVTKENEKCLIFSVYGDGGRCEEELTRHKKVMDSQEEVFSKFNIPLNRFSFNPSSLHMSSKLFFSSSITSGLTFISSLSNKEPTSLHYYFTFILFYFI